MNGAVQGADAVRSLVLYVRTLYERQEFHFAGPIDGTRFLEDYTALLSIDEVKPKVIVLPCFRRSCWAMSAGFYTRKWQLCRRSSGAHIVR